MATITVSHLGKVADAEISLAPLNILVGKNDTGKTYVANLIWAIGNLPLINGSARRGRRPTWLAGLVKPLEATDRRIVIFEADDAKRLFNAGKRELQAKAPQYLARVFGYEGFEHTIVGIRPDEFTRIEVKVTLDQESFAQNGERAGVEIRIKLAELEFTIATYPVFFFADYSQYVSDRIFYDVFGVIAFGLAWRIFRNPIYIPAARTGLMLSLSSLIDEAMDYSGEDRSIDLPLPLAQFLQRMQRSNLRPRLVPGPSRDLLNDKMIDGQLTSKRGPIREYRYTPRGLDKSLPLHAVSSMVTELVPLAIDLRSSTIQRHIVFEEPEAHLHLEAQRDMARVIARLLAEGNFVTLTTHSDTFLQQINNLMALHNHARKKELLDKFGYTEFDTIDPNMAKAHEFCPSMDGTTVRQLDHTSEGFIVPTLNETLLSLAKETIELRG